MLKPLLEAMRLSGGEFTAGVQDKVDDSGANEAIGRVGKSCFFYRVHGWQ